MVMPQIQPNSDLDFMARALVLAREVRGHVWPNPPVGCVIVKDREIIAEAATHPGGRPHAERQAIDLAGQAAAGATLYVTLEPCCHWGKTPPCANAIIEARISRVVCSVQDPDSRVNGGGFAKLREAGIDVSVGICREEAEALMSGFFHRLLFGVPEVVTSAGGPGIIPKGADAVLSSSERTCIVTTRSRTIETGLSDPNELLGWMGRVGLTTVAIPEDHPFWSATKRKAVLIERTKAAGFSPTL